MDRYKVKVSSSPRNTKLYGRQSSSFGLDIGSKKVYDDINPNQYENISRTAKESDRSQANIEAEKGETVLFRKEDGSFVHQFIGGKRHSNGGTPLNVPDGSFIFSDTDAMKLQGPMLAMFGKSPTSKAKFTPADLAKKYDLSTYKGILDDPRADAISKKTAKMMTENNLKKLAEVALLQESKKGFAQGVPSFVQMVLPQFASPEQQAQNVMKYGGALVKAKTGIDFVEDDTEDPIKLAEERKRHPERNQERMDAEFKNEGDIYKYYRRRGYAGKDDIGEWQDWLLETAKTNPRAKAELIAYLRSVPLTAKGVKTAKEKFGVKASDDPSQLSDDDLLESFRDHKWDFRAPRILGPTMNIKKVNVPYTKGKIDFKIPNSGIPVQNVNIEEDPYGDTGRRPFFGSSLLINPELEQVYGAPISGVIPNPTFKDPNRELAANAEQANITQNYLSSMTPLQSFMSNVSGVQGKAAENVANTMGRYQNENVGIANQFAPIQSEIMNKLMEYQADRADKMFYNKEQAKKAYKNDMRNWLNNIDKYKQNEYEIESNTEMLNSINPNYSLAYGPRKARVRFKPGSPLALMSNPSATNNMNSIENYESEVQRLIDKKWSPKAIEAYIDLKYPTKQRQSPYDDYAERYLNRTSQQ